MNLSLHFFWVVLLWGIWMSPLGGICPRDSHIGRFCSVIFFLPLCQHIHTCMDCPDSGEMT